MRKYLPTLAELVDRLSIAQLKEVFITEHKEEYAKEKKLAIKRSAPKLSNKQLEESIVNLGLSITNEEK